MSLPRLSAASGAATAAASVNYKSCWNYSLPKFCESSTLVAGFKIERGLPDLGSSWFWDACTTLVLVLLSFSAACETETMNVYSRGKVRLLKRPLTSQSEVYWKQCSSQCSSQCFLLPVPRIKMLAYGTANSLHHWYRETTRPETEWGSLWDGDRELETEWSRPQTLQLFDFPLLFVFALFRLVQGALYKHPWNWICIAESGKKRNEMKILKWKWEVTVKKVKILNWLKN